MYVTNCCLTNAYSDPDVRQVTSHAGTLCADQKLAVPESVKLKISSRKFIKCNLSCSQQGGDVGGQQEGADIKEVDIKEVDNNEWE